MKIKSKIIQAFVTCFGLGFFPKGPGTLTSAVAVVFWVSLHLAGVSPLLIASLLLLLFVGGVWAVRIYEQSHPEKDRSEVVIDEWVGIGVSLLFFNSQWWAILAAFVLFRVFDIWKPMGVRYFDENYMEGWGVMMDDVIAGVYACALVQFFLWLQPQILPL